MAAKTAAPARDLQAEVAFLTRALKAPTLRDCVERLAERARAEGWSEVQWFRAEEAVATVVAAVVRRSPL